MSMPPRGFFVDVGTRQLQVKQIEQRLHLVDKETQEVIKGVREITIEHTHLAWGTTVTIVLVLDPEDILPATRVVDGEVIPERLAIAPPQTYKETTHGQ